MRMAEAADKRIAHEIARAGIPAVKARVRRRLYHAVGNHGSGEGMPVASSAYHRVHQQSRVGTYICGSYAGK